MLALIGICWHCVILLCLGVLGIDWRLLDLVGIDCGRFAVVGFGLLWLAVFGCAGIGLALVGFLVGLDLV